MIIPIDDKCRVKGTEMCWQLERLKEYKTGKKAGTVERPLKQPSLNTRLFLISR
jgi:hypothetical protein